MHAGPAPDRNELLARIGRLLVADPAVSDGQWHGYALVARYADGVGNFGIVLPAATALPEPAHAEPVTTLGILGDFAPRDSDPARAGVQVEYDAFGNIVIDLQD